MEEKLLTTREVSRILGIPEKDVIDLANSDLLPHFKMAGEYLRFKRKDILKMKEDIKKKYNLPAGKHHNRERLREFFYFYDFYVICSGVIVALLWVIVKDFHF
ncbi:MAG: helix-turn-helix domain-containing protein [Candidatus Omnitrophica bacterium]|nr:helix-turn-helix domain-containing protein [Candidatus Omnitrophota bacterium]